MVYKRLHEQSQALQLLEACACNYLLFVVGNIMCLNVIYVLVLEGTCMASQ